MASVCNFFTASEMLRIYVVRCFELVARILYGYFYSYMQLLSSKPIVQNVHVI